MRKLLIISTLIIVLFVGLIVAVPYLFKDKIVGAIKELVNKELTATVDFDENVTLSLLKNFPNIYLGIDDIEVVNTGEFLGDTLVKMEQFSATIDIMSVIQGDEIRIRSIKLIKPTLHAKVLPDGKANWDITKSDDSDTLAEPESDTSAGFKISLKNYEIVEANVVYDDQQANMKAEVLGLNHSGKGDFSQDDFLLQTQTAIQSLTFLMDGIPYMNKVNTEWKMDMSMNMPAMRFEFKENTLRLNALEVGFDGFVAMPDDAIAMDIKLVGKKTSFKELLSLVPAVYTKDFDNMTAGGILSLDMLLKGTYNSITEEYPAFDIKLLIENGSLVYAGMPEKLSNIFMNLRVNNQDGNLDHTVVNLQRLDFLFGKDAFSAKMLLNTPLSNPYVDLKSKGIINLANLEKIMPLEPNMKMKGILNCDLEAKGHISSFTGEDYEAMQAVGTFSLAEFLFEDGESLPLQINTMDVTVSPQKLDLKTLDGKYGHSDYQINGVLENYMAYVFKPDAELKGNMQVYSNLLDCNSFLSEDANEQSEVPEPSDTMELTAFVVPANVNFDLNLNIGTLLYDNYKMDNLKGKARVAEQTLYLEDVSCGMLDGKLNLSGTYSSVNPSKPESKLKLGIESMDIQKVYAYIGSLKVVAPIVGYVKGKFNAAMNLDLNFDDKMNPILSSLSSDGFLKTHEAILSDFKPINSLSDALNISALKQLSLLKTNITYLVRDGKVSLTKPIDIEEQGIKLHIFENGFTTFEQIIDYNVKLGIPSVFLGNKGNDAINKLFAQAGRVGVDLKMPDVIGISAHIGGTLKDPKVTTRLQEMKDNTIDRVKDEINRIVDEQKEEIKKNVELERQRLIKNATEAGDKLVLEAKKKAEAIKAEARKQADKVLADADKEVDDLVKKAGSNPIAIAAAKKSGELVKKEARKRADELIQNGNVRADEQVRNAEKEKAKLIKEAETKKIY